MTPREVVLVAVYLVALLISVVATVFGLVVCYLGRIDGVIAVCLGCWMFCKTVDVFLRDKTWDKNPTTENK